MLKMKYYTHDNTWKVYNSDNPDKHSHFKHKRVALKCMKAVKNKEVPQTHDIKLLESCIRLSGNRRYKDLIESKISILKGNKYD